MTGFDIHFQALESCRTAVRKAWNQYESLHDDLPEKAATPASLFGSVDDAAALAGAVDAAHTALVAEAADARSKLRSVEGALETVQDNVRTANRATSNALRA